MAPLLSPERTTRRMQGLRGVRHRGRPVLRCGFAQPSPVHDPEERRDLMDVVVKSRHCSVADEFRALVEEKLARLEKLDDRVIQIGRAHV